MEPFLILWITGIAALTIVSSVEKICDTLIKVEVIKDTGEIPHSDPPSYSPAPL